MMSDMFHTLNDVMHYVAHLPEQRKDAATRLMYIQSILAILGNPQDKIPVIHIAGTSGKGSTAYYAAELLRLSGKSVGLVVSPHVTSVMERAQVYSNQLDERQFAEKVTEFVGVLENHAISLSYIEFFVVFAYWLFADLQLDVMVVEVGMGGRLDATNVLNRSDKIAAITDIGYDHVEILGDSLPKIAAEKAGIITRHGKVFMNQQDQSIEQVIRVAATDQQAQLNVLTADYDDFQARNLGLAVAAVRARLQADVDPSLVARAARLQIPGRFEALDYHGHRLVLDVAHNPQKITALVAAMRAKYGDDRIVPVVAFGSGKQQYVPDMMQSLRALGSEVAVTSFPFVSGLNHQSLPVKELERSAREAAFDQVIVYDNPRAFLSALDAAMADPKVVYLVTGSFYVVDAVRSDVLRRLRPV